MSTLFAAIAKVIWSAFENPSTETKKKISSTDSDTQASVDVKKYRGQHSPDCMVPTLTKVEASA